MGAMSFTRRYSPAHLVARSTVGALLAGVCVAAPGALAATDTGDWADATISPGQTLILVTAEGSGASLRMSASDASTLPAGWSVISRPDGLRMSAPTRAEEGEFATVQVTERGDVVDEIRVSLAPRSVASSKKSTATSTVARVVESVAEPTMRTAEQRHVAQTPESTPSSDVPAPASATPEPPHPSPEQASVDSSGSGWFSGLVDRVNTFFGRS